MTKNELNENVKTQALADCLNPSLKLSEIAEKYDIPLRTLKYWRRREDVPQRPRGARPLAEPSARAKEILDYASAHGFSKAAKCFDISKQFVSILGKRWGVRPPMRSSAVETKPKVRKPKREVVVCFRLRKDELSLIRSMQPPGQTPPARSNHKLVRAVVLAQLENMQALELPLACPNQPAPELEGVCG
jgi:transposase-like protein